MIKYEIKKLVRVKFLWLMLLLFTLINFYKIYLMKSEENNEIKGHAAIYNTIKGTLTEEKVDFVTSNYKLNIEKIKRGDYSTDEKEEGTFTGYVVGDKGEFEYFYNELKYIYEYSSYIDSLCKNVNENIRFYKKINNSFEYKKNNMIKDIYEERSLNQYFEMKNVKKYIEYDFSSSLILVMLLLGIPEIILLERQTKMEGLLCISNAGIAHILRAKISTILIFVFCITAYFSILDFISFSSMYGLDGFNQPLYGIEAYKFCSLNIRVYQFMILNGIIRAIAFLFLAYVIFLLATVLRKGVRVAIAGLVIISLFIWIGINTGFIVNPIALLEWNALIKEFHVISILGHPVLTFEVISIALIVGMVLLIGFIFLWTKLFMDNGSEYRRHQISRKI